jgi:hypothetical protein
MIIHLLVGKITFSAKNVDPNGIGGGKKECNINNQAIFKSLLTWIRLIKVIL